MGLYGMGWLLPVAMGNFQGTTFPAQGTASGKALPEAGLQGRGRGEALQRGLYLYPRTMWPPSDFTGETKLSLIWGRCGGAIGSNALVLFGRGNQGLERPRDCPLLRYLSGKSFPFRQIQLQSSAPLCARWPCSPPPPFFHLENWHRHLEYTQPRVRLTRISPPVSTYGDSQAFFKKLW